MDKKIDDGGTAFPFCKAIETNGVWNECVQTGMSLRDYFAGQALIGLLSNNDKVPQHLELAETFSFFTHISYLYADAMIKEHNANNDKPA